MGKAVLTSIQPKWVEKIASGEKTIEVRKSAPKCDVPFKGYIYCTKAKTIGDIILCKSEENAKLFGYNAVKGINKGFAEKEDIDLKGKVIGEFVCDNIDEFFVFPDGAIQYWNYANLEKSCLTYEEIANYIGKDKKGYAWHISDLKIYNKPKELSEFYTKKKCDACEVSGYESTACVYDEDCKVPIAITRAPQSWQYVEEL